VGPILSWVHVPHHARVLEFPTRLFCTYCALSGAMFMCAQPYLSLEGKDLDDEKLSMMLHSRPDMKCLDDNMFMYQINSFFLK